MSIGNEIVYRRNRREHATTGSLLFDAERNGARAGKAQTEKISPHPDSVQDTANAQPV